MNIGLLADTHDNLHAIRYLVQYFQQEDVEVLIHAGDFIAPFTIPELDRFGGPVWGVFGNNDGDRETLRSKARDTSVNLAEPPRELTLGNRTILVSHRPEDLPDPVPDEVDLTVNGHTHEPDARTRDGCLSLNPGEAGGWLTETTQAMVLDTETLTPHAHVVPAP